MFSQFGNVSKLLECHSGTEAVKRIEDIYHANVAQIRHDLTYLLDEAEPDSGRLIFEGGNYPFVGLNVRPENMHIDARLSYGVATDPGAFGTTVTCPSLFREYYQEQIDLLIKHHNVPVMVGESDSPIPIPFAVDPHHISPELKETLESRFHSLLPNLSRVNDNIANYHHVHTGNTALPLALFTGERVDYSLHRLMHYTRTYPEFFQSFILLTNYDRYIQEFIDYAMHEIKTGHEYTAFVEPGNYITYNQKFKKTKTKGQRLQYSPQIPAYHLVRPNGQGITFVNIGVGPSNAKTITDHLAVLRPHCWLMLGHCAGLRRSQALGDYVLAHGYVRKDHALDEDLSLDVPLPAIAELQVALQDAVAHVTGLRGREMKKRMRTGTVLTTDNRNWELLSKQQLPLFNQTRAIAVDMESATIAANGFRFRVPYGTLLCVSDKPIYGELKLQKMATKFYQDRVSQHLQIGIEAIRLIRELGVDLLHSRKLRGFEEPPFR
ncbi:MAG: AMP nucleosidase [Pseudomonadota bacterium]